MPYDRMNNPGRPMSEILTDIDNIICWHKAFNDRSMVLCHAAGLNGFKRLHRTNTRCFLDWHLCIENEAFDKYRETIMPTYSDINYNISDIVGHLQNWNSKLEEDIKKLAMLNNEYREQAGRGNHTVKEVIAKMVKNHEKSGRWYRRFQDTKSQHDIYQLDDKIHSKYKAMEASKGYES